MLRPLSVGGRPKDAQPRTEARNEPRPTMLSNRPGVSLLRVGGALLLSVILSCALTANAICEPGDITATLLSDTTWPAFAMNPDGTAGALLGVAHCVCACGSGCPAGATNFGHPYCWGAALPPFAGACWIWEPGLTGASEQADLHGVVFARAIEIPGLPTSGTISIAADDFAEVRVNGVLAGATGSTTDYGAAGAAQGSAKVIDLLPFLQAGTNVVQIRAQNGPAAFTGGRCDPCTFSGNPAGVLFGGRISFTGATPAAPSSWGGVKIIYR